jgi:hypothetical protein
VEALVELAELAGTVGPGESPEPGMFPEGGVDVTPEFPWAGVVPAGATMWAVAGEEPEPG